jgi:VanZ family protein
MDCGMTLDRIRALSRRAVWLLLALILFASLSSIESRPHLSFFGANLERFSGFFAITAAFGLAYPRRLGWLALGLICLAIGLELAQTLVSSRHGRARDAAIKIAGVIIAATIVAAGNKVEQRLRRRLHPG